MKTIYLLILLVSLNSLAQCWQSVSAGYTHSLGIKNDGTLWAWGENNYGQLGNGTTSNRNVPTQIGSTTTWRQVVSGRWYSLAIKFDGTLWAWGYNGFGQLGIVTASNQLSVPTQVGSETDWAAVSAGNNHTLAVKANGTLWAWGSNDFGKLGINATDNQRNVPTQIGTATSWTKVAAGEDFSLALQTDGRMWGWGNNISSQLGNGGTPQTVYAPIVTANAFSDYWMDMATGYNHSIAIDNSGIPSVWGGDDFDQLGNGNATNTGLPWGIGLLESVRSIEAGYYHSFIVMDSGKIMGAGRNNYGQLGNGTINNITSFSQIGTATDYETISAGAFHTLAIMADGTLKACGRNDRGQLGDGTNVQRNQFTAIVCPTTLAAQDFTSAANPVKVYPNPAKNILTISSDKTINKIAVYNIIGQQVFSKSLDGNETSMDISGWPAATYFVKVFAGHELKTLKVIKE